VIGLVMSAGAARNTLITYSMETEGSIAKIPAGADCCLLDDWLSSLLHTDLGKKEMVASTGFNQNDSRTALSPGIPSTSKDPFNKHVSILRTDFAFGTVVSGLVIVRQDLIP
jgi:hypothetical protein